MKQVIQIEIKVTLEDGRHAEVVWVRKEKIAEILHSKDLGPTVLDLVRQIPDEKVPS